jgi:hypothetical protein
MTSVLFAVGRRVSAALDGLIIVHNIIIYCIGSGVLRAACTVADRPSEMRRGCCSRSKNIHTAVQLCTRCSASRHCLRARKLLYFFGYRLTENVYTLTWCLSSLNLVRKSLGKNIIYEREDRNTYMTRPILFKNRTITIFLPDKSQRVVTFTYPTDFGGKIVLMFQQTGR